MSSTSASAGHETARVAVIGAGAWGTTISALASAQGPTTLWALEPDVVATITDHHENRLYLPDVVLPDGIRATTDLADAVADADVVIVATPAQFLRDVMARAAPAMARGALVVSLTKGIEARTTKRMTEVLTDVLAATPPHAIGVLAGPNLAREVIAGHPAATVVAFGDHGAAAAIQQRLTGATFRVYTSSDVVGCEIGGAVKNVIAIAAGAADGLGCGMNTMAAVVTRGLAELTRLGVALGGDPLTFLGLAGNGDLIATCGSRSSRNHQVGQHLAEGRSLAEILEPMTSVAEGVTTAPVLIELARRHDVEMPIVEAVVAVLDGQLTPREAIAMLMTREPKPELHGLPTASAIVSPT